MTSPVSAIEAIEKAMEGVTPGLWAAGYSSPGARSRYIYANNGAILEIRDSEGRADSQAIATFIAACSPDRMREVLALARQAEALEQEVDSLKQTRQHSREASAALHDAFMEERKRVEALQRVNAELREAGDTLAAQTRSYQRGFSGTLPLGQALNNWDKVSARSLLGGKNAE